MNATYQFNGTRPGWSRSRAAPPVRPPHGPPRGMRGRAPPAWSRRAGCRHAPGVVIREPGRPRHPVARGGSRCSTLVMALPALEGVGVGGWGAEGRVDGRTDRLTNRLVPVIEELKIITGI